MNDMAVKPAVSLKFIVAIDLHEESYKKRYKRLQSRLLFCLCVAVNTFLMLRAMNIFSRHFHISLAAHSCVEALTSQLVGIVLTNEHPWLLRHCKYLSLISKVMSQCFVEAFFPGNNIYLPQIRWKL
jgi:hypothetical protein